MSTSFSLILGSIFSFGCLSKINSEDKIEIIFSNLDVELKKYSYSTTDNITILFPKDFTEYNVNGQSFEDVLLNIVENDLGKWQYYLSELEKIIVKYVNYQDTNSLLYSAANYSSPFPAVYLFVCEKDSKWPNLDSSNYTYNWNQTLTLNSNLIAEVCSNLDDFVKYCRINFEFIEFHDDILSTIETIQGATYENFINSILHALNVLNQAYHIISTDPNQNLQDLHTIIQLSENLGLRLNCTRQGRNKVEKDFALPKEIKRSEREIINCEYHLKIDNYDSGLPTHRHNNVRIYFGLKSYQELPRKRLTVAHIGRHL